VTVDLSLPGSVLRGSRRCSVEQLFVVTVDMWPSGAATTTLHTFSDCWLSHDLRGHKQPDVQKQNAALLRAVLGAVTEQLGAPIEPWDPGVHGAPTEFGFEDFPDDDPDLLDSWFMFEVPRRTEWLHGMVPKDTPRYGTTTSAPVDFVQVAIGDRPIGYVWADARGDAAGYEPRPAAGHAALDAAQDWLMFLGKARRRGLSARDALHEAIRWPGTDRSGTVVRDSLRTSCSVEDVQDLSGREYPSAHALP
jgi:hypothetical protein